ncbi:MULTISPECIES: glycosyltransferase family 2 protein [Prochlorococcus]|uniref:Glycosyltransferase n=1 Tax=Prochlorococcus marinus str. MIT 9116 TaxID=167544 RepID=A0A0A1ZU63_PROMR|nr:glycosyltransferase family 2 protein [Prochlorococcus marinus]KGF91707.1 Glycosyltransferase [Prochlorococcus marinus str. MIT 9107]KGF93107.1 Glycosyltransferase [Prochlorococcus marinus str. MIT 9116]KGF95072.1 Glycosyltransferase [Prochlorococcus marinus str. MIT 9123]
MYNTISYVIPIFNEELNIPIIIKKIIEAFNKNNLKNFEIVFIDDGSSDKSVSIIKSYIKDGINIKCICLTRNFGHQEALTAGLAYANSDLIAILDGDLQDPPLVINEFIKTAEKGYDVIYGIRKKRKESILKRISYKFFYKILSSLSNIYIPIDSGDFCLMTNNALKKLNDLPEKNRFIRGLRSYIGLRQLGIPYERESRYAGSPKYNFRKLLRLASDGIFNFSDRPLKITSAFGFLVSLVSLLIMLILIIQNILTIKILGFSPNDVPGYTSIIVSIFFVSGVQLFAIGIIGEYISRIFLESKKRPTYLIREIIK